MLQRFCDPHIRILIVVLFTFLNRGTFKSSTESLLVQDDLDLATAQGILEKDLLADAFIEAQAGPYRNIQINKSIGPYVFG